jgi:hypothetical protein
MYQPYIRGKQFELLGIRELINNVLIPNKEIVSPIIEPVKNSSTLKNTLKALAENDINFTVIANPQVGSFKEIEDVLTVINDAVNDYNNFQIGIIFHKSLNHNTVLEKLKKISNKIPALSIIHSYSFEDIDKKIKAFSDFFNVKYNVVNLTATSKRYHRNFELNTRIELDDYFNSQAKNSDYLKLDESNFSEEYKYFREDGFIGFSDYLSIGENYSETGFLPYAVAIHISFKDRTSQMIKIKHFVSESNDDTSDIAGKFDESITKLIHWCDETGFNSIAIPIFRKYHQDGHFPGLGILKKLSLMNHIDLVLKLLR